MDRPDVSHRLAACLALAAIAAMGLWSWNTLAGLFGAPEAQSKHAVSALALLAIARLALQRRRSTFSHRHRP